MNGQIDWQAQQISNLVCSLTRKMCSEAWGTFSTWTGQSITALIAWRKEEWRKEAADIPPSKVENDLCSTRQILALFLGQPWGDCREKAQSAYGPFRAQGCHLELKLETGTQCCAAATTARWPVNGHCFHLHQLRLSAVPIYFHHCALIVLGPLCLFNAKQCFNFIHKMANVKYHNNWLSPPPPPPNALCIVR